MTSDDESRLAVTQELAALQEQLVSLADMVESVFAESIIALVESDLAAAKEVREEDYRAHKVWLQADRICVDLLASGGLSLDDVHLVCAYIKIAQNLKMMADRGVYISRLMNACPTEQLSRGAATDVIPRMAEIAQNMLSDITEALVSRTRIEAQKPQMSYRELEALNGELFNQLADEVSSAKQPGTVALVLMLVGQALLDTGQHVLDVANHLPEINSVDDPQQLPASGDEL